LCGARFKAGQDGGVGGNQVVASGNVPIGIARKLAKV
jgi:hypothetical protein